jgi:hypothetical protein
VTRQLRNNGFPRTYALIGGWAALLADGAPLAARETAAIE